VKTIRAFIAIELPVEIRRSIHQVVEVYQRSFKPGWVRWVGDNNLHLTLKFLGDTPMQSLPAIQTWMDLIAAENRVFTVCIAGSGMFPSARKPRVIWLGLDAKKQLADLARSLDDQLGELNIPKEERPFSPHLTIGRVSRELSDQEMMKLGEVVLRNQPGEVGKLTVDHIALMRSELRPEGPLYSVIHRSVIAS